MMRITEVQSDDGKFRIELKDTNNDLWAVMQDGRMRLSRDYEWGYEPIPSNRSDEYIKEHSFTFVEAKERLQELEDMGKEIVVGSD